MFDYLAILAVYSRRYVKRSCMSGWSVDRRSDGVLAYIGNTGRDRTMTQGAVCRQLALTQC